MRYSVRENMSPLWLLLLLCATGLCYGKAGSPLMNVYPGWANPNISRDDIDKEDLEKRSRCQTLMKFIDGNFDGKATLEEFREKLYFFDTNGDGMLDESDTQLLLIDNYHLMHPLVFEDMWYILKHDFPAGSAAGGVRPDHLSSLFQLADVKGKGYLTWVDFAHLIVTGGRQPHFKARPTTRVTITRLDLDDSKGLSHDELTALFGPLGPLGSDGGISIQLFVDTMMHLLDLDKSIMGVAAGCMDVNQDGTLSTEEQLNLIGLFDFNVNGQVEAFELELGLPEVAEACRKQQTLTKKSQRKDGKSKAAARNEL